MRVPDPALSIGPHLLRTLIVSLALASTAALGAGEGDGSKRTGADPDRIDVRTEGVGAAASGEIDATPHDERKGGSAEFFARALRQGLRLLGYEVGEDEGAIDGRTARALLEYRDAKGHAAAGHGLRFTLHTLGMDVLHARPTDAEALRIAHVLAGGAGD